MKISRPVPEKPITEAMQQGKEPLRSFGDLMQFLKKGPSTDTAPPAASQSSGSEKPISDSPNGVPSPSDTSANTAPVNDAPALSKPALSKPALSKPEGANTQATGDDDVGV